MFLFHPILEIHPHGAGVDYATHRLPDGAGRLPVARFHIGSDGDGDPACVARNRCEHFVATDALAVGVAEAERDPRTGGREGGEAGLYKNPGTARVPRIGEHEHRPLDMEPAQRVGFTGAHRLARAAFQCRASHSAAGSVTLVWISSYCSRNCCWPSTRNSTSADTQPPLTAEYLLNRVSAVFAVSRGAGSNSLTNTSRSLSTQN